MSKGRVTAGSKVLGINVKFPVPVPAGLSAVVYTGVIPVPLILLPKGDAETSNNGAFKGDFLITVISSSVKFGSALPPKPQLTSV